MKMIVIHPDETAEIKEYSGYQSLFDHFGGYIEPVYPRRLPKPFCIVVDESGKLRGLKVNPFGSWLYETDRHGETIVGDVILLKQVCGEDGCDLAGLSDAEIKKLLAVYNLNLT
jgi:hypothetical protein